MAGRRILVTGAHGQLGHDLVSACAAAGDEVTGTSRADLDITDPDAVAAVVRQLHPHAIVNCAAWTAVDACESDPVRAERDNSQAVRGLRAAADEVGAHLVQISTDYVFSGDLDRPYREDDLTGPRSVYGRTKLGGERAAGPAATIVRTSWVCGEHGGNMVKTVLRLLTSSDRPAQPDRSSPTELGDSLRSPARRTPSLAFVADQRGNPTFTAELAPVVRRLAIARAPGVFHVTNAATGADGRPGVSWFEFVREIVAAAGGDPDIVRPILTADLDPPRPAPRPANSVLANTALASVGIEPPGDYRVPLAALVARLRPGG